MNSRPPNPPGSQDSLQPRTPRRVWIIWVTVLAGILLLVLVRDRMGAPGEILTQHRFEQLVESGQIRQATINYSPQNSALNEIVGLYYRTGENGARLEVPFRAQVRLTPSLEKELLSRPEFEPHEPNSLAMSIVVSVLPFVIIAALIWFLFIRQIRKSASSSQGKTLQQQERLDKILTKWEEQARRMDAVLDKMEKHHRLKP